MLEHDSYNEQERGHNYKQDELAELLPKLVISSEEKPNDAEDKISHLVQEHLMIQVKTRKIMSRISFCGGCLSLAFQMRSNIFALYARTMDDYDNNYSERIGIAIYLNYVVSGIFCLLFGFIGDSWRFDYLLVVANMIDVCTFFIEANARKFLVLSIAYIIGGQAMQSIIFGYMCKILSIYDSKQIQMRFVLFYAVGYIIGPITGGLIAYFTSYRTVFYVSACIATVLLIYTSIFFANTQTELVSMQLELKQKIETSGVLNDVIEIIGSDHMMPYCNINTSINDVDTDEQVSISGYRWLLIGLFTVIHGILYGGETSWICWYSVYITQEFNNGTVAISTGQVSLFAIFFFIGTVIILKYIKLMQTSRDATLAAIAQSDDDDHDHDDMRHVDMDIYSIHASNTYDICHYLIINMIVGCIVCIIVLVFCFPETNSEYLWIYFYWIYCAVFGLCFSLVSSSGDSIMMQIMPKIVAGKGFGAKTATVYFIRAIPAVVVGFLWDNNHDYLFYVVAVSFLLILILLLVVVACEMCFCRNRNSQLKEERHSRTH